MVGQEDSFEYRGVIPRAINDVFKEIQSRTDTEVKVRISYFEIYNEQIIDLISEVFQLSFFCNYLLCFVSFSNSSPLLLMTMIITWVIL